MRQLKRMLSEEAPDPAVRQSMAPSRRRNNPMADDREIRTAGVLMLLYHSDGEWRLPLIVRPRYDGPHSGQVALPGGRREEEDLSLWDTAVREAEEEIGIHRATVRRIGVLNPLFIPNSRYMVTPYVGWMRESPHFKTEPEEVSELLRLPVELLLRPNRVLRETWDVRGQNIEVPFYRFGPHRIWGATAMMLCELLYCWARLAERTPEQGAD